MTMQTYEDDTYEHLDAIPTGWAQMTLESPIIRPGQQVIYDGWNGITLHTAKHFIGYGPAWAMYYNPNEKEREDATQ